jgi:hypothetical protein
MIDKELHPLEVRVALYRRNAAELRVMPAYARSDIARNESIYIAELDDELASVVSHVAA